MLVMQRRRRKEKIISLDRGLAVDWSVFEIRVLKIG
jgi:hypothetical protein